MSRADLVDLLASFGDRGVTAVGDHIDSLELAWLLHQVEQRYGVALDLDDDELTRMSTVDGAISVLRPLVTARP